MLCRQDTRALRCWSGNARLAEAIKGMAGAISAGGIQGIVQVFRVQLLICIVLRSHAKHGTISCSRSQTRTAIWRRQAQRAKRSRTMAQGSHSSEVEVLRPQRLCHIHWEICKRLSRLAGSLEELYSWHLISIPRCFI